MKQQSADFIIGKQILVVARISCFHAKQLSSVFGPKKKKKRCPQIEEVR